MLINASLNWTKKGWLRGLCVGHTPGAPGDTDNADRWLCVSLSNKAQFSMHLEVGEF